MTRKHYQMIANQLATQLRAQKTQSGRNLVETIAFQLACNFEFDNPAFNKDKFMEAVGV